MKRSAGAAEHAELRDRAAEEAALVGLDGLQADAESPPRPGGRFELPTGGLRRRAARGTIVNAAFFAALSVLGLAKGLFAAAFLTTGQFGVWGMLALVFTAVLGLKQVGVTDKYIEQDELDQERAFQKAFTLDLLYATLFSLAFVATVPLLALGYGRAELLLPGLVLALALPALALQTPIWVFYRRMQFGRQRSLQALDPVVSLLVTVGLAVAGFGYWSLVVGVVCGSWAAALAALAASPYRLALRYDRGTMRQYVTFSWPLITAVAMTFLAAQVLFLVGDAALGAAAVGAMTLNRSITLQLRKVNDLVTQTLYPAVCAVKERTELLLESFAKSNLLSVLWAFPLGAFLFLFMSDVVAFGIGEKWRPAVLLFQLGGLNNALNQVGFNWTAYYRARGETRPMAVGSFVFLASALLIALPLLVGYGLDGFAVGMALTALLQLVFRAHYIRRLFPSFSVMAQLVRGLRPTLPPALAVLALRFFLEAGERTLGTALGEAALFLTAAAAATVILERRLIGEMLSYLRRARPAEAELAS